MLTTQQLQDQLVGMYAAYTYLGLAVIGFILLVFILAVIASRAIPLWPVIEVVGFFGGIVVLTTTIITLVSACDWVTYKHSMSDVRAYAKKWQIPLSDWPQTCPKGNP